MAPEVPMITGTAERACFVEVAGHGGRRIVRQRLASGSAMR
jgi:hypothetical protein